MNAAVLSCAAPMQRPLLARLLDAMAAALTGLSLVVQRAAERRTLQRQHALVARLEAQTLRDIGLGDWVGQTHDSIDASYHRAVALRGF